MRKFLFSLPFLLLALCLPGCEANETPPPAVGVVDVEKVLRDSKAAQAAREHLKKARDILQKGMEKLEAEYKNAPEKERRAALAEGAATLNRQMAAEEQSANQAVLRLMREEAVRWQRKSKAPCVVASQNLLAADAGLDATPAIIEAMDKREPGFAELPRVEVKKREAAAPAPQAEARPAPKPEKRDEKRPARPARK